MRRPPPVAIAAALLLASVSALGAQATSVRQGLWVGAGIGRGSARLSCQICRSGRDGGTSGYLRAGTTLSPAVLLGLEGTAWYHSDAGVDQLLASLQAVVYLYPRPGSGFYVKTGIGLSSFSAKDNQDEVSSHALAGQVGVGYEVPMGQSLSIVPFANFLGSTGGNIRFNNTVTDLSANTSLLQFGVGLTLH